MAQYDAIATYIMAPRPGAILYTGVTSDLAARVWQHKNKSFGGFSAKYGCTTLVWFELHADIGVAIGREKQIKHWPRAWKLNLIQADNPEWRDGEMERRERR